MSGYTKMPNDLMFDKSVTPVARLLWCALAHVAWEQGAKVGDQILPPPQPELARSLGVGVTSLRGYITDLTEAGYLTIVRSSRRKPLRYVLHEAPETTGIQRTRTVSSTSDSVPESTGNRMTRGTLTTYREKTSKTDSVLRTSSDARPADDPPPIRLDNARRNLPLDTLLRVCDIDPDDDNAVKMAVTYLNGRTGHQGIRHLYWIECHRYVEQHPDMAPILAEMSDDESSAFAETLAQRIERKAGLYTSRFTTVELTPKSLRDWWMRLENRTADRVTGDDLRSGRV